MPRSALAPPATPYIDFDRASWHALRSSMPQVLTDQEIINLRGIGERVDSREVTQVYLPLSRLIHMRVAARQEMNAVTGAFLGAGPTSPPMPDHVPFIIGIAGSVAVGKSTTARLLQVLLQRWDTHPRVDLVTTDGFLYPTAELQHRGLMKRKGFPESYDRRALLRFVTDVKSGRRSVQAPVYSHTLYDRVPNAHITVDCPDILILEGLNVLQTSPTLMISDFFDFSVYVDAHTEDIESWYIERFLEFQSTAFREPGAHFSYYAELDPARARAEAREIWQSINLPNLVENIAPTKVRASLILEKQADHSTHRIRLRKI